MDDNKTIIYRINEKDIITFVNQEWVKSAELSGISTLSAAKLLNRSLWEFITDVTTKLLYRKILMKVRSGKAIRFNIRCDAVEYKQSLELTASIQSNGDIQFESRILERESHPPQIILDNNVSRSEQILIMCSWCNRINVENNNWQALEKAIIDLKLFEDEKLPQLSHGICNDCYLIMSKEVNEIQ